MGRKNKIVDFGNQRNKWLESLTGDDRNSVRIQLQALSWDVAAFTIIGEAIKLSPRNESGRPQVNSLVIELLKVGFYANLLITLRRLTDRRTGTVSLTRVLMDMKEKAPCITRTAILSAEDKPYDYAKVKEEEQSFIQQNMKLNEPVCVPSELDWEAIANRHRIIDRLVGRNESNRQEGDHLPKRLFEHLIKKIETSSSEVKDYADNFVAHAAEKNSDKRKKADELNLVHGKLIDCHRSLCQVFSFVRCVILGDSSGPMLAYPTYDHFAFIDHPIVSSADVSKLREHWDRLQDESFRVSAWGVDDYEVEYGSRIEVQLCESLSRSTSPPSHESSDPPPHQAASR